MGHGGKRTGAGRKPNAVYPGIAEVPKLAYLEGEAPAAFAQRVLTAHLPALLQVALTKAIKEGDSRMLIYCTDRMLGSPVQPIDLEVSRAAARLAAAIGADPEFLIRRAQQLAAENASAEVTG